METMQSALFRATPGDKPIAVTVVQPQGPDHFLVRRADGPRTGWVAHRDQLSDPDGQGEACQLEPVGTAPHVRVRCTTHGVVTLDAFASAGEGYKTFRCDGGTGARFLMQDADGPLPPRMLDLTGLYDLVDGYATALTYSDLAGDPPVLWRWAGPGRLEALAVKCVASSEFDEDDYASRTWQVQGPDSSVHLTVTLHVDGRV